jgi:lipopolysaccharide biosynthesis protein
VRYLQRLKTPPERVVFANDSVFFLPSQIQPLLESLDQDAHAFVAVTDNSEFNYHVGSFLFSVSGAAFTSKTFRKFWREYFPYSTRRHVIHRGELGLSRQLMRKGGFTPHVLCPGSAVGAVLRAWTPEDLRANFFTFSNALREMIQASQLLRIYEERGVVMAEAASASLASSASHEQTAARSIALAQLLDRMIEKIERGNGIHVAGALMAKHLNLGIVKKDLAYREVMNMTEVIRLMEEIGYPDLDFVKTDLRKRGTYASMKGIQKLQFRRGFI